VCGGQLGSVLETLEYVKHETDVWFELTTLLIPGMNDSDEELDRMTTWVADHLGPDVPMHFTAFHPDFKLLDRPPTPPETLTRARRIATGNGIRYAYTGNVHDTDGASTQCHHCGQVLVERDWYELGAYHLTGDGRCSSCGTPCAGVFDGRPGTWGARRQPVRLGAVRGE
jgi:pyruvate formate lyase activating enzyme